MRFAGRPSWRFGHGNGSVSDLHFWLFVRDTAGLSVPAAPDVPPPLAPGWLVGGPPAGLMTVRSAARATAASQWLAWWRRLVAGKVDETRSRQPAGSDTAAVMDWLSGRAGREDASFDPPEFASLASAPELRAAVAASYAAWPRGGSAATSEVGIEGGPDVGDRVPGPPFGSGAEQAGSDPRPRRGADRSGSFDYYLVRSIAEQTAADFGVPIDAVDGTAHVLDVQGSWWHVAGPGSVLCSPAATTDPAAAAELLRAVFASRLASGGSAGVREP
jgi:hypothetical protein